MTAKQISRKYKLTINTVTSRINSLDLKPTNKDKKDNQYCNYDIKLIVEYLPKSQRNIKERKKLMIIEYHIMFPKLSYYKIAKILVTDLTFVKQTILKWYLDNQYLTIQSKL